MDPQPAPGGTPQVSPPTATNPFPTRAPVVNTSPVIAGNCNSNILGAKSAQVALTPTLTFHWKLVSNTKVQMALEYIGDEVWLGLASSFNGQMIGSTAIIGVPGTDDKAQPPTQYTLTAQNLAGVKIDGSAATLQDREIVSEKMDTGSSSSKHRTVLTFTKTLNDPNDQVPITKDGLNTLLYAAGSSRDLAYHEHRGSFRLNLNECDGDVLVDGDQKGGWTNHGTFAAHGFFAILAWGFASPIAVAVAWFRTLVPTSWIYIHVFFNASTFIMTFLAFWIAVGGVGKSDGSDHFSKLHHYVGLILMVLVTVQVLNGFLRPPVERKDRSAPATAQDTKDTLFGCFHIPDTPREMWQWIHRSSGLTALALGVYQISSGLGLYADRFGTISLVKYFFIYVGLFLVSLVGLKMYVSREEDNARRGVVQAVNTSDIELEDEEPQILRSGTYS
jgi:cytochrome b561